MKGTGKAFILFAILGVLISCDNDESVDLPPADERVSEAKSNFRNELTAPENGWKLEYQPTSESGSYLILLNFDQEGNVNIKSDVSANDGEFHNQTITYRIDNAHGLELILETYAVFHYMFELDASTFGAEFEFLFKEKNGDNLVFESISDGSNPTQLIFEPAKANAEAALSREMSENLDSFSEGLVPNNFGILSIPQQIILEDQNISVFWSIDNRKRSISINMAGIGTTAEDIISSENYIGIFHNSVYTLSNEKLILKTPLTFSLDGKQIEIGEIALNEFDMSADPLCPLNTENGPKYQGQVPGSGSATLINTNFSHSGREFQPGFVYSVNIPFVTDSEGFSLSANGIIQERYPDAGGFYFIYDADLTNDSIPSSSIGIALENGSIHLREFETTTTQLNKVEITLTDNYYFTNGSTPTKIDNINAVTDEIFEGGEIYAYDFPNNNLTLFRLFNPCNGYEIILVQ